MVEQGTENPRVVGSIPTGGTIYADLAHLVERDLAKVEVAGSSPVIRSNGGLAQLGEHLPYKQRVIGSSPIPPTKSKISDFRFGGGYRARTYDPLLVGQMLSQLS